MKKLTCFIVFLLICSCEISYCEELKEVFQTDYAREACFPDWAMNVLQSQGLDKKFEVSFHLNPFYLRGDFDGDKIQDIAVLVKNRKSKKYGILIIHKKSNKVFIIGAGNSVGNGGDNFDWMDVWQVYDKGPVHLGVGETTIPILKGDALKVMQTESASGLIYWNGKKYLWYQQGD